MLQHSSRPLAGAGSGSDRSGLWTLEGMSLLALCGLTVWAWVAHVARVDQFLGWIYVFVGGARLLSGAVHRGPGLGWMLTSAVAALAAGAVLLLRLAPGVDILGSVLALYLLAEAFSAFGLSSGAGAWLASAQWLSWVAIGDILLAAAAVTAASNERQGVVIIVVAVNLWLEGVTMLVLGHRWETRGPRRPRELPLLRHIRTGSRTYRPWSRGWRAE
jgi:hypothetical protein